MVKVHLNLEEENFNENNFKNMPGIYNNLNLNNNKIEENNNNILNDNNNMNNRDKDKH